MKYSYQREIILETLQKKKCHFTAKEIYEKVKQTIPKISLGTVYRNLNILSEHGKIKKIEVPYGSDQFDFSLFPHSHLYCIRCNKIYDLKTSLLNNIKELIEQENGYQVLSDQIVLEGICTDCQKENRKKDLDGTKG